MLTQHAFPGVQQRPHCAVLPAARSGVASIQKSFPVRRAPALLSLASIRGDKLASIKGGEAGAAGASALVSANSTAKRKVEWLLDRGSSLYSPEAGMKAAIEDLVQSNPTPQPGPATLSMGQGTWEVFYAPHIAALSSALGTHFQPIRYILEGDSIMSNVFYSSFLAQEGWLSTSGKLFARADDCVEVAFDRFWIDVGSASLRHSLEGTGRTGMGGVIDSAVNGLGRAAFFPQFAVFPVNYLDADMAVFTFLPLDSMIAVHKLC